MVLQPDARLQVQVVRRLVEEQHGGPREKRLCQGDAHAPAAGHVLGRAVHGHLIVRKPQAGEDLARAGLRANGVELVDPLRDGLEALILAPALLHDLGSQSLQALGLLRDVRDHGLHCRLLRRRRLFVQVEHVHEVWQRHLSLRNGGQDVTLPAAVVPDEAVSAAWDQLQGAVLHELVAADLNAKGLKLHVHVRLWRGEYSSDCSLCRYSPLLARELGLFGAGDNRCKVVLLSRFGVGLGLGPCLGCPVQLGHCAGG
mmetsp:Transcript_90393/g.256007  ORF Transcript_90393/g.256007 Transcript_90393/m.256007 type:complete len:257 (+) Transcript_90393:1146-1916(+)